MWRFSEKIPIFSFPNHLGHRNYVEHKYKGTYRVTGSINETEPIYLMLP